MPRPGILTCYDGLGVTRGPLVCQLGGVSRDLGIDHVRCLIARLKPHLASRGVVSFECAVPVHLHRQEHLEVVRVIGLSWQLFLTVRGASLDVWVIGLSWQLFLT